MELYKNTTIVEAAQYTRNGLEAEKVAKWCNGNQLDNGCEIETPEGTRIANYGDWIIKREDGDFSSCDDFTFKLLFKKDNV